MAMGDGDQEGIRTWQWAWEEGRGRHEAEQRNSTQGR